MNNTTPSNYKSSVVSVTSSETLLSAFNKYRSALILYNQGTTDVRVYFGSNSTMYFILPPREPAFFPNKVPLNLINAVSPSGTVNVTVLEG